MSALERSNVGVGRLLHRHGIPDWRWRDPEEAIPLPHFIKAFDIGARAIGEERFGIIVAERAGLDQFAGFGEAVRGSLTVYGALRTACRLATKEATTLRIWLQRTTDGVLFSRKQLMANPDIESALPHMELYTLTVFVQIVRLGAGPHWRPTEGWLSVREDAGAPAGHAFADARIHFCAPFSGIWVPEHVLCLPITGRTDGAAATANAAERRLRESWADGDFADTVRLALRALIRQKSADIDTVAEIAGISARTLQRRLAEQGTSFSEALGQPRYQAAASLLRQSDIAVADVSDRVGYEHPQHFIRAFRRWAGVTPGGYRGALVMANEERMDSGAAR